MSQFDEPTLDVPSVLDSENKIKEKAAEALEYLRSKKAEDIIPMLAIDRLS